MYTTALDHGALPGPTLMIARAGRAAFACRLIGWVTVATSIGFVGLQLWQHAPWQLAARHLQPLAVAIVVGMLLYGMSGFLLSSAWHQLLGAGGAAASIRSYHAIYGRTQIAKYVPGNVFHLVGRQVMGRRLGHGQKRLALASMLEAVLLVLIAGGLGLPTAWRWLDPALLYILALAGLVLMLVAAWWFRRRRPHRALGERASDAKRAGSEASIAPRLLRAATLYAIFFVAVGVIFWTLALSIGDLGEPSIDLASIVSVVALAWLAGFVTLGSSAGIGVREAVLIAALEGTLGVSASTLIALSLRLVSIGGDVVFLALSMMLGPAGDGSKVMALGGDRV